MGICHKSAKKSLGDMPPRKEAQTAEHSNFQVEETTRGDQLSVQKIIRDAFSNPERRKFAECKTPWGKFPLHQDDIDPEFLIERINAEMPDALKKFNQEGIKLEDTARLFKNIDTTDWLSNLKALRWHGPFKYANDVYFFTMATEQGCFQGLHLSVYLDSNKSIFFYQIDKDANKCGKNYGFTNAH